VETKRGRKIGGGNQEEDQTRVIPEPELSELSQQVFEYDDNILDEYHKMRVSFICRQKRRPASGPRREKGRKGEEGEKLSMKLFTPQSS